MFEKSKAKDADRGSVLRLYNSLKNMPGCTWDESYPTTLNIDEDLNSETLYCLRDSNGKIIAVASAIEEVEWEEENSKFGWTRTEGIACGVARVGVCKEFQGQGTGRSMMEYLISELKNKKYEAIHMLVSKTNLPALSLYRKLGFCKCGEVNLYEKDWDCFEMLITQGIS
ncbi:MAG TPA: GNAT family N-acetyltransferase [Clostridiaceae bacterium]